LIRGVRPPIAEKKDNIKFHDSYMSVY